MGAAVFYVWLFSLWTLALTQEAEQGTCGADGCLCINKDEKPTMGLLKELEVSGKDSIRIMDRIGRGYTTLGISLLNDKDGNIIREIEDDNPRTEKRVDEILHRWLLGKGLDDGKKSITWNELVKHLKFAKLLVLANDIESVFCPEHKEQTEYGDTKGSMREALSEKSKPDDTGTPSLDDEDKWRIIKEKEPLSSPEKGSELHEQLQIYTQEVILIVHTINDNEKWAALANMDPPKLKDESGNLLKRSIDLFEPNWIVLGEFGGYKAALIQTEMGANAHDELTDALNILPNVRIVVAVGVAAGSSKFKLCDVLVSKWIDGVGNMKFTSDGYTIFRASGSRFTQVSQQLNNIFARGVDDWMATDNFTCSKEGRKPSVKPGSLISAPTLVDNEKMRDQFIANDQEAIGLEMEGFKLVEIKRNLEHRENRDLGVIVIKGVSDFADGSKNKIWQFTAAMAAARYAKHKLEKTNGFLSSF